MGGMSITHWLIVLVVVVLIFGTKKLKNIGGDLGGALKSFRKSMSEDEPPTRLEADPKPGVATEKDAAKDRVE